MTTQDNKALVRRYREAHNANNLALLDEFDGSNRRRLHAERVLQRLRAHPRN
jgi:hypothetical protein